MNTFSYKNLSIFFTAVLIASCAGKNSNPLDKYPGLKIDKPSEQSLETQTIVQPDLFQLQVNGSNDINQGQFIEGQTSQIYIKVLIKSNKIKNYKIEMIDFNSIERPSLMNTTDPNIFTLQWTPPIGIIPGGQLGKTFNAQFLITVIDAPNKILVGLTQLKNISLVVNRNNTQPQIIGHTDLKSGVDEGFKTPFSVDVEDLGGRGSPRLPEMQITPYLYSNTEAYRANASQYIFPDESKKLNPEKIGPQRFRFYYFLDIDRLPLNRDRLGYEIPAATSVDLCFQIRAVSAILTLSDQIQICTTARYAVQPPQFFFDEAELKKITSGVENTISFKVNAEHLLSSITLKNANQQIAGLSGQKSLSCDYKNADKKNELICILKWTPLCQKVDSVKALILKADNDLESKTKSTLKKIQFTILAGHDLCIKQKTGAQ